MTIPTNTRRTWMHRLFTPGVFLLVFVFFYAAHPLVLLSLDDWAYYTQVRVALPSPTFWNPSRVLPEVLMPLCGTLTGPLNTLFFHDYVQAQAFAVAVVYSLFITLYICAFRRLVRKRFALSGSVSALLALLFLLLHFLIFRSRESGNEHLFATRDVCCVFFYTIPALLCSTLVMLDLGEDLLTDIFPPERPMRKAWLLLALYLALFSNLYGSGILAVYLGCRLLFRFIDALRRHGSARGMLRAELLRLLLLALWLLAALFEALGGRAAVSFGDGGSFSSRIRLAFLSLKELCASMNVLFLALLAAAALFVLLVFLFRRRAAEKRRPFLRLFGAVLAAGLLCALYLVLLSAVAAPDYTRLPYASFGAFFYLLLLLGLALAFALSRFPRSVLLLPLALLIVYTAANTGTRTFADANCLNVTSRTVMALDRDLIAQLCEADAAGLESAEVHTLSSDMYDNWPHSTQYLGDVLAEHFWKCGVLSRRLTVTLVPDPAINARYSLLFGQTP